MIGECDFMDCDNLIDSRTPDTLTAYMKKLCGCSELKHVKFSRGTFSY